MNTLMSKYVLLKVPPPPQTPFAAMSSRAPACELAVALHTSVRRVAVRSRISLCLIDGKPPLAQDRACSTEKEAPQAHFDCSLSGVQPYRRARASWKAPLCRVKPYSVSGKAVSQEEEPFSLARFTDLRRLSDRRAVRSWASFEFFSLVCCLTVALDSNCLAIMSYTRSPHLGI